MKRILIMGASGFIGREVSNYLSTFEDIDVIRYSRTHYDNYFSCQIGDSQWQKMLMTCNAIINCSGVGLAKIKKYPNANEVIAKKLVDSIPNNLNRQIQLLHLSSIKAYNPNHYHDAYSDDKFRAEKVLLSAKNKICGELLRIPAVFSHDDPNLIPLFNMAKKGNLPSIKGNLNQWYWVRCIDVAFYVDNWLNRPAPTSLKISYLLSSTSCNLNDLILAINSYANGNVFYSKKKNILYIKAIYYLLALKSFWDSGLQYNNFPQERFQDLFVRKWEIESADDINIHWLDIKLDDIFGGHK